MRARNCQRSQSASASQVEYVERKRLGALGYFIESGDGQHLVMRLDYPVQATGSIVRQAQEPTLGAVPFLRKARCSAFSRAGYRPWPHLRSCCPKRSEERLVLQPEILLACSHANSRVFCRLRSDHFVLAARANLRVLDNVIDRISQF